MGEEVSCGIGRDWGCDLETVRGQIEHPAPRTPGPSPESPQCSVD